MIKCTKCGREIHEEARFCPYCMEKRIKTSNVAPAKNKYFIWFVIEFIVIIGLVVTVLIFALNRKSGTNKEIITSKDETTGVEEITSKSETTGAEETTDEHIEGDNICYYRAPTSNIIWEYSYNATEKTIRFNTSDFTYHKIDLEEKSVIESNVKNLKIVDCYIKDEIIVVKLGSEKGSFVVTYVFDVSEQKHYSLNELHRAESINDYVVYDDGRIEFGTTNNEYYYIDYMNSNMLLASNSNAELVETFWVENMLTVKVKDEVSNWTKLYLFDISQNVVSKDTSLMGSESLLQRECVTYFNVFGDEGVFELDTFKGPMYKINIGTGELLECSSIKNMPDGSLGKVLYYKASEDTIVITVISGELPEEMTYVIEFNKIFERY